MLHPVLYLPLETLLAESTTAGNKMIASSQCLLLSQPLGGRNVFCGRYLAIPVAHEGPRPATEGRRSGGPQFPHLRAHTAVITAGVHDLVTRDASA
jgi:hypothetical protein